MTIRRWQLLPLLLLLCAQTRPATMPATSATAPGSMPASMPATTQSVQGEVRQVVLSMLVMMREGDRAGLLALCHSENPGQKKRAEAMMELGIEAHRVNKAAVARWGALGDNVVEQFASEKEFKRLTQAMSKATVMIEETSARVEPAETEAEGDDLDVIFLKRVGGRWLIDFSKILEEPTDASPAAEQNNEFLKELLFVKNTLIQLNKDIESGKYAKALDAKTFFDKAVEENMKKSGDEVKDGASAVPSK